MKIRITLLVTLGIAVFAPLLVITAILLTEPDTNGVSPRLYSQDRKEPQLTESRYTQKYNVIIILADDLGYGDLGVQGSGIIKSPNIDAMAAQGTRLTQYYASASICSPSRASLLTGRYPARTGVTNALQNSDDTLIRKATYKAGVALSYLSAADIKGGESLVSGLPESELTLAEALKQAGYRTMGIGKWHLGDFTSNMAHHPFNHGFDEFVGFNASNDEFPAAFWRGDEEIIADIGAEQSHYTRLFTDEAIAFIERNVNNDETQPFFLYLAHKDVHLPFFPGKEFAGKSDAGPYGDAVAEFDWSTGAIIDTLDKLNISDNTLVIVTSDNGPWYEGDPGNFRGRKGLSYEGGFRVPFIVRLPNTIPSNMVLDTPVMGIDLFPTILTMAGLALPNDRIIDGRDVGPLLISGEASSTLTERPLFFFKDMSIEGMRIGDWKFYDSYSRYVWPVPLDKPDTLGGALMGTRNYQPQGSDIVIPTGPELPMLHNISKDPTESYNVAKRYPEKLSEMQDKFSQWQTEFYNNPRGWKN